MNEFRRRLLLVLVSLACSPVCGASKLKILVIAPTPAWSHMQYMGRIADTLAEAGHQVHFLKLAYDATLAHRNETQFVHRVYRLEPRFAKPPQQRFTPTLDPLHSDQFPRLSFLQPPFDDMMYQNVEAWCTELLLDTALLDSLGREHFDVGISEMLYACPLALLERIRVRTKLAALVVSTAQFGVSPFGVPTFSSYVPNTIRPPRTPAPLPFLERAFNFYNDLYDWMFTSARLHAAADSVIRRAFGGHFPLSARLFKSCSLLFVNGNPFMEFTRPMSSKIVHIGGIVTEQVGQLDQRAQSLLEGANKGAVLFSFGSVTDTRTMPAQMVRGLVRAFARFPDHTFIWKLDPVHRQNESALFASAPNVHLFDWVQQPAILRHPKLRAFISHCGHNSVTEAANAGVPVVAIPLFADQLHNAMLAVQKGFGVFVDLKELKTEGAEQAMVLALQKVLHEPGYRSNAQLLQRKVALTPFSARDRLVRWVEFAAHFPHLDELNLPTDEDLHWFVYYSLDVIALSLGAVFLVATLLCSVLVKLARMAISSRRGSAKEKEKSD